MPLFQTLLSYGSSIVVLILVLDKYMNGTARIRKEIGDTYKERADQLQNLFEDLKKKFEEQGKELAMVRGEMKAKDAHISQLNATILNRNPELERILESINKFLGELSRETRGQTAMLIATKERDEKIDKATAIEQGHVLRKE